MFILGLILALACYYFTYCLSFYLILARKIAFGQAFKLALFAAAINKLIFSGSGFLASGYLARNKNLSFGQVFPAFIFLEIITNSIWLGAGIYFGSALALGMPLVLIALLIIVVLVIWRKKSKFSPYLKDFKTQAKTLKTSLLWAMPTIILNVLFYLAYYYFLFRIFSLEVTFISLLRIVSIAFCAGYLSFAPSGIGFKEAGMVGILMTTGVDFWSATSIALWDRAIITLASLILGSITGGDILWQEIKRLRTKDSNTKFETLNPKQTQNEENTKSKSNNRS